MGVENIDEHVAELRAAAAAADEVARAAAGTAASARKSADAARAEALTALEVAMSEAAHAVSPRAVVGEGVVYSGSSDPDSVCPEIGFKIDGWRVRLWLARGTVVEFATLPTSAELRLAFQLLWPNGSGLAK